MAQRIAGIPAPYGSSGVAAISPASNPNSGTTRAIIVQVTDPAPVGGSRSAITRGGLSGLQAVINCLGDWAEAWGPRRCICRLPDMVRCVADGVDLVLFDLGGVLIELAGVRAMLELTGIESEQELWRRWLTCRWVRRFESGGCSETEFAAGVVADWQLDISASAFLVAFRDWPTGPLTGAAELVAQTRVSVATGCFSNTNALHWYDHIAAWPLASLFDHRFLSFELGLLKPDIAAFAQVADLLDMPARRVLFLDDNAMNVAGAAAADFQAARVAGVGEARQRLVEAGVLSAVA